MKIRLIALSVVAAVVLSVPSANAHDPSSFDKRKKVPKTCAQLADTERYWDDVSRPDIKALKTHCDAQNGAAPKPSDDKSN